MKIHLKHEAHLRRELLMTLMSLLNISLTPFSAGKKRQMQQSPHTTKHRQGLGGNCYGGGLATLTLTRQQPTRSLLEWGYYHGLEHKRIEPRIYPTAPRILYLKIRKKFRTTLLYKEELRHFSSTIQIQI